MNVQSITNYSSSKNTSFGARPVGLARELLTQAYANAAKYDDQSANYTGEFRKVLSRIAGFANNFYGENKPLEISAKDNKKRYTFFYKALDGTNVPYAEIRKEYLHNYPLQLADPIIDKLERSDIGKRVSEIEALVRSEKLMEKLFGKA